jgi:CheY-like chemotaxis protein
MREKILSVVFVGDNPESCELVKSRLESISMEQAKEIQVFTAVDGEGIHASIIKMDGHMPHLVLIESRDMDEEFCIVRNIRRMIPMQKFVLLFDRKIDKRMMQSLIIQARQNGFDLFLAKDAEEDEIVRMLRLVAEDFHYSLKALAPVRYLLEKTD